MRTQRRSGFSLMEILVATAILLVAVGVLSELAYVGTRHASSAEEAATAQRICQNILEEILCGARSLETVSDTTVLEDPEWLYSVDIKPLDQFQWSPGLAELRVTVTSSPENGKPGKPFSLVHWIRYVSSEKQQNETQQGQQGQGQQGQGQQGQGQQGQESTPASSTTAPVSGGRRP
jgi:prepilin-type N-terminal cleavage/methylation domain-containing protein